MTSPRNNHDINENVTPFGSLPPEALPTFSIVDEPSLKDKQKHIMFLHGWGDKAEYMRPLRDEVMSGVNGWTSWIIGYAYLAWSFRVQAMLIAADLKKKAEQHGYDFSATIFVGFSMGGVIARQMAADGFPCKALVTSCSPHEGLGWWVPTPDPGSASIAPHSADLFWLNNWNDADKANRSRFNLLAITHDDENDSGKFHDDDSIVPRSSAIGKSMGQLAWTETVHYGKGKRPDPHFAGRNVNVVGKLTQRCKQLIAEN